MKWRNGTMRVLATAAAAAAMLCGANLMLGDDWPQWRGPTFNGASAEKGLPEKFGPSESVLWTAKLPGGGASTPGVVKDRVFLTAQDKDSKTWALCLSLSDGKETWKQQVGAGFGNKQGNTAASPSPIVGDGQVYFPFGTGELCAFDLDGKEVWRRDIQRDHGKFDVLWAYSSSPLLHGGKLYVPVIHGKGTGKSFLLCLDPKNGKDLWKVARATDAGGEACQAYTTPIPARGPSGDVILVVGADYVTAHDPADGKEVWRSPSYRGGTRTVPSAVVCDGMVLVCAPKNGSMCAAKIGDKQWAWQLKRNSPDVCTPAAGGGKFYVLDGDRKVLVCVEAVSGKVLGECDLGGKSIFQASPTLADGRIYCLSMGGEAVVASAQDTPKVLHRADFGGKDCRASVVAADGRILIRSGDTVYCIGQKK